MDPIVLILVLYDKQEFNDCLLNWVLSAEKCQRSNRELQLWSFIERGQWHLGLSLGPGESLIQFCSKWPWLLLCWLLFLVSNKETSSDCQQTFKIIYSFTFKTSGELIKLLAEIQLQQQRVYLIRSLEFTWNSGLKGIWNYLEYRGNLLYP